MHASLHPPRLHPRPAFRRGAARRRGASAVEYALIAGLVACGIGAALVEFGPPLNRTFATIESALSRAPGPVSAISIPLPGGGQPGPGPGLGTNGSGSGPGGGGVGGGTLGTSSI